MKQPDFCFDCWRDAQGFFRKRRLKLHGYLPNEEDPAQGEFVFIPWDKAKEGIVSISVKKLGDLYQGHEFEFRPFSFGSVEDCPKYCLDTFNTKDCNSQHCPGRVIRELMSLIDAQILKLD